RGSIVITEGKSAIRLTGVMLIANRLRQKARRFLKVTIFLLGKQKSRTEVLLFRHITKGCTAD
ncbi:MAG: hypothetical protein E6Y55_27975, partial [Klebsiella michiganensis]|nr:hypothetical protein [Klebsiella michiganensis]